ncbi:MULTISPECIES: hypothetical protein [Actinosynnema]|uniref:hypothetical protein n=1 Tax=Actinosynnema TaxID=40566 RepID=UPI0020A579A5|nr:hypothetical protein [Actinosynnema pretiosum]MCP2097255.1 hypothetical protein [Actinosynnema pretiosum]
MLDWLFGLARSGDPAVRFAGVLAARRTGRGGCDPRHVDVFVDHLGSADLEVWTRLWTGARKPELVVRWAVGLLGDVPGDDRDGRTRLMAALLRRGDPVRRGGALFFFGGGGDPVERVAIDERLRRAAREVLDAIG